MPHQELVHSHTEIIQTKATALSTELYLEALFEQWLALECLSDSVRTHLKHLHIGLTPLVKADEAFLTHHHHPLRQALRALIEHCYLYTLSRETTLFVKVEYKIHQLSLRFLQGTLPTNANKTHSAESICEEIFSFLKSLKTADSAFNERYMTRLEKENISWLKSKEEGSAWVRNIWQDVPCPIIWQFFLVETVPFLLTQTASREYIKEHLQTIHAHCFSGHQTSKNAQHWLSLVKAMREISLDSGYNYYVLVHFSTLLEDHLFFNTDTAKETSRFVMHQAPTQVSFAEAHQTQKDEFEHILKKVVGMQSTKRYVPYYFRTDSKIDPSSLDL